MHVAHTCTYTCSMYTHNTHTQCTHTHTHTHPVLMLLKQVTACYIITYLVLSAPKPHTSVHSCLAMKNENTAPALPCQMGRQAYISHLLFSLSFTSQHSHTFTHS